MIAVTSSVKSSIILYRIFIWVLGDAL